MKILIVDDEKDIVDLVAYNLEKEGYETLKALDGEKALQLVRTKAPDLVVLDLMLPGIQGLEVCKRLRQDPSTAWIPIIMLTAKGEEIDKVLGLEVGRRRLHHQALQREGAHGPGEGPAAQGRCPEGA